MTRIIHRSSKIRNKHKNVSTSCSPESTSKSCPSSPHSHWNLNSGSSSTCVILMIILIISQLLIEETTCSGIHHLHIPLRYRRKLKYGAKLAVAVGIAATKKVWLPVPIPLPIPIPIFKTYQPILIKKKAWIFGGLANGLGFGGLHGGLGVGGFGYG